MKQLRFNVDEKRYSLLTQLLEALEIEYEAIEADDQAQKDALLNQLPNSKQGPNLDDVNIRQYVYE